MITSPQVTFASRLERVILVIISELPWLSQSRKKTASASTGHERKQARTLSELLLCSRDEFARTARFLSFAFCHTKLVRVRNYGTRASEGATLPKRNY